MTRPHQLALAAYLILIAANSSFAKEWRGLVPLRSTRSDVIRTMNQCQDHREACRFTVGNETVHILFSGGLSNEYSECAASLPPETVMFIEVQPKTKLKLSDLHLAKRRLQYFDPANAGNRRFKGYRSDDGLVLSLFNDSVVQLVYFAAESDNGRCTDYYQRAEGFVEVMLVHVPVVYRLEGPESIKAGEKLQVIAYSNLNETRGYTWTATAGKIIAGQYTKQVTIDTTELAGQMLTVTAEIDDTRLHAAAGSIVVKILPN